MAFIVECANSKQGEVLLATCKGVLVGPNGADGNLVRVGITIVFVKRKIVTRHKWMVFIDLLMPLSKRRVS